MSFALFREGSLRRGNSKREFDEGGILIVTALASAALFALTSALCSTPQFGNSIFAFASGVISGTFVNQALNRIVDAANVARTDSIVRDYDSMSWYRNYMLES